MASIPTESQLRILISGDAADVIAKLEETTGKLIERAAMTEFDLWESALAKRDNVESRTVHGDARGTGVYVSRTFFSRHWTRFYMDPVYHVFIGGRLIVSTTDYLEAYAVWSREEGIDTVFNRDREKT